MKLYAFAVFGGRGLMYMSDLDVNIQFTFQLGRPKSHTTTRLSIYNYTYNLANNRITSSNSLINLINLLNICIL